MFLLMASDSDAPNQRCTIFPKEEDLLSDVKWDIRFKPKPVLASDIQSKICTARLWITSLERFEAKTGSVSNSFLNCSRGIDNSDDGEPRICAGYPQHRR